MDRLIKDAPEFIRSMFSFIDGGGLLKIAAVTFAIISHYLFDKPSEQSAAIGAGVLVLMDSVTGYLAAWRRKQARTSHKLGRVITKSFGYLAVITIAAVCEDTFSNALPIVDGVLWLIIATEGYSILENVERMGLGRFAFLRSILGKVLADDHEIDKKDKEDPKEQP